MLYAGVNKVSKTLCFNRLSSLGKELWHFDQFSLLLSRTVHMLRRSIKTKLSFGSLILGCFNLIGSGIHVVCNLLFSFNDGVLLPGSFIDMAR